MCADSMNFESFHDYLQEANSLFDCGCPLFHSLLGFSWDFVKEYIGKIYRNLEEIKLAHVLSILFGYLCKQAYMQN